MTQVQLVGVSEIAEMAGVTKQAVSNWRARHDSFPPPYQTLQTGSVWDKEAINRWIKNHKGDPTHVISFINLKGGVGKTTLCTAVAEVLAREKNKHVLVIDLDPQTNATVGLISEEKWADLDDAGQTLAQLFQDSMERDKPPIFDISKAIVRGVSSVGGGIKRLELLPSSIRLIDIQERIPAIGFTSDYSINPLHILKNATSGVMDRYDYVLIDCPPSLGTVTKNGLAISTGYVIPTVPDIVSTWGIYQIVKHVAKFSGGSIKPLGIIASKYQENALHRRIIDDMKNGRLKGFPNGIEQPPLFSTIIHQAVAVARGADVSAKINTLAQKYGVGFGDFLRLTEELDSKCLQMTN